MGAAALKRGATVTQALLGNPLSQAGDLYGVPLGTVGLYNSPASYHFCGILLVRFIASLSRSSLGLQVPVAGCPLSAGMLPHTMFL